MKVRLKGIYGGSCNRANLLDSPANPTYGYEGTPLEIVRSMMRDGFYFYEKDGWVFGYLERVSKCLRELGFDVSFSGKTDSEVAESFLNSCRDAHLLTVIE